MRRRTFVERSKNFGRVLSSQAKYDRPTWVIPPVRDVVHLSIAIRVVGVRIMRVRMKKESHQLKRFQQDLVVSRMPSIPLSLSSGSRRVDETSPSPAANCGKIRPQPRRHTFP